MKGAYFTVLAALRRYLAPIKDIVINSLSIVIGITLVFSVSSFLTSMNDAQGHDTFTVWVRAVSPSMFVIAIVLSLFKIEGSGIGERHIFPQLLDGPGGC
jgi:hypothetical protein